MSTVLVPWRHRLLVPVLVFLGVVATAVGSLGAPLLPTVVTVEHVSLASSQWALTISLLVGAVATPLMGRLGAGRWRRPVILAAVLIVGCGCMLAALPLGFPGLLVGRALQGVGLGLVPLAIATARDALTPAQARPAAALLGVTTAVGLGIGYPLVGLVTERLGLSAAFWLGGAVTVTAFLAAVLVLPGNPGRPPHRVDVSGTVLFATSVTGMLVVLAHGQSYGWGSARLLVVSTLSAALLVGWVLRELRAAHPLVDLRLARHRSVLAANSTMLLVGLGCYPLLSLVVRLVQTPTSAGYGFGGSVVVAGLMLVPFSLASFAASRVAGSLSRRSSPEHVVSASCAVLLSAMAMFLVARSTLWELAAVLAVTGLGVGCVFAVNPIQIMSGVPAAETGSALGFYQVLRSVAFSAGSALSATLLATHIPAGEVLPTAAGYTAAARASLGILLVALLLSMVLARSKPSPRTLSA